MKSTKVTYPCFAEMYGANVWAEFKFSCTLIMNDWNWRKAWRLHIKIRMYNGLYIVHFFYAKCSNQFQKVNQVSKNYLTHSKPEGRSCGLFEGPIAKYSIMSISCVQRGKVSPFPYPPLVLISEKIWTVVNCESTMLFLILFELCHDLHI